MPQLGYVQKLKFNNDISFDSLMLDKISENLSEKTTFIQYENTMDLYNIVTSTLGNNVHEVINCMFDEEYLVQCIYCDLDTESGHEKIIFLKRKILENDTYTFLEFDHEKPEVDKYVYEDIQLSDISNVIRNRNINIGVFVECDEDISDIEFIDKNEEDYVGKLTISCDNEIKHMKYINLLNILNKTNNEMNENEEIDENIRDKIKEEKNEKMFTEITNKTNIDLIYTQINFCYGLLNCYSQVQSEEINTVLTKLMGQTIYGDGYICMETNVNNECRAMNMNKILFNKILNIKISGKESQSAKNKYYINIYNELE
jgi:hypothetical protein